MEKVRFFWDFYGAQAAETAAHFRRHLEAFLLKHDFTAETSLHPESDTQVSVTCDPPDVPAAFQRSVGAGSVEAVTIADQIGRALRPQRVERVS